jgi:hypothetical protein
MGLSSPDDTLQSPVSEDDPTERFARQICPSCGGMTTVPLFDATSRCELCAHELEVAPLVA